MPSSNHLHGETSLYLLQHADNPVDWYPWGEPALTKARQENKPILLSIGYSACHWCHVMAHESFADPETAKLMNQWFINIKVDREERPDLDKIYQTAHQLLTGRPGGWPLTVFLTPDKWLPFYAGTYFPVEASFGRPGFKTILSETAHFYYQRSDVVARITQTLTQALEKINYASAQGVTLDEKPLQNARQELEQSFDFIRGGFGRAPKFPLPTHLEFLLCSYIASSRQDIDACRMLDHSLTRMAQGGFTDQLGGGFFRYCVDENWMIPHFEKMLYDNAQLIALYADFSRIKADNFLKATALAALDWVLHKMRSPQGGFYATLNADSEGVEGKYYYWDRDEVRRILTPLEYSAIERYFGLNRSPNFEGHWHLFVAEQDETIHAQWLSTAKQKLLAVREKRVPPSCDKKIIVSWNALLIKALIKSAVAFSETRYLDAAKAALDFIDGNLWENRQLLAVSADNHAHLPAYLDDYAFLLSALLSFLQLRWQDHYFQWAIQLAEKMLTDFFDNEHGGFFYTATAHEPLVQRLKIFSDEALPAGNGVAVSCLLHLGYLLGEKRYLSAAEKTLQAAWEQINLRPSAHDSLLAGLRAYFHPLVIIILRSNDKELLVKWQQEFNKYYLPNYTCYALADAESHLPPSLQKPCPSQGVYAYICRGFECGEPIQNFADFSAHLLKVSNIDR